MSIDSPNSLLENVLNLLNTFKRETLTNEVRTTIPGYIIDFDSDNQLATVQIGVQRLDIAGKTYTPPQIIKCPVCIYGGAGGFLEVKIEPDDECLIHFSMRCIDGWRQQGGVAPLVKLEKFPESDAFVELGPRSLANVIQGYDNDGIKLRSLDGSVYVWLKDDSTIEISNGSAIATFDGSDVNINGAIIDSSGNVVTASGADLDALNTAYNAHTHVSASPGSPTSGPTPTT